MVNADTMVIRYFTSSFFMILPLNAYNKAAVEVKTILAPFVVRLDAKKVNYTASYSEFNTYYEHYDKYSGPLPLGNIQVSVAQYGAWVIQHSVVGNITET